MFADMTRTSAGRRLPVGDKAWARLALAIEALSPASIHLTPAAPADGGGHDATTAAMAMKSATPIA